MGNAKSVFISYSSLDGFYVEKLTRMLEKMEISYWKAPDMIPAGSNYAKEIPQAIQNCQVFVLLLSESSQKSIWVEKEIDSAIYYRKRIIPFQIDDAPLNDMFRFYLNNVQTISYYKGRREAIEALKGRLCQILGMGDEPGRKVSRAAHVQKGAGHARKDTANSQGKAGPARKDTAGSQGKEGSARKDAVGSQGKAGSARKTEGNSPRSAEKTRTGGRNRTEALTMNHVPEECQYCGGEVRLVEKGTYRCQNCGKDNYDYFQTIRNYLEQMGARSALEIERDTGIPRRVVEYLLKQDYLEIPRLSPVRISCERCGSPIRSGRLCELCMRDRGGGGRTNLRRERWHSGTP